jgi:MFS family permease
MITTELKTTHTITNLSVALFLLSMSIFPLWWSSFSERLGRRTIYLVSFTLFLLWTVLAAVSTNISMLVVMRMLGGGAAASVQGER